MHNRAYDPYALFALDWQPENICAAYASNSARASSGVWQDCNASRTLFSLNSPAICDSNSKCSLVAASGTSYTNTSDTGLLSGASNSIGSFSRTNAPVAADKPACRPCGMATPCPSAVEPNRSRANRQSNTSACGKPLCAANSCATHSNRRFLLLISASKII